MAGLARIAQATGALLSVLHPRENFRATGTLGAVNAEVVLWNVDGCQSAAIDLRGSFSLIIEISGTVDGSNWIVIPFSIRDGSSAAMRPFLTTATVTSSTVFEVDFTSFSAIRVRCTSYTSGAAVVTISASLAPLPLSTGRNAITTTTAATNTGAAGSGVTLNITNPGSGLRNYITGLQIDRFATTALTAAATPVVVTTTNLPGSPAFTFPADAALQGSQYSWVKDFDSRPLASTQQAIATTIVCPATTAVIWRVTAYFFVAP